jgi:hypothetical protein
VYVCALVVLPTSVFPLKTRIVSATTLTLTRTDPDGTETEVVMETVPELVIWMFVFWPTLPEESEITIAYFSPD